MSLPGRGGTSPIGQRGGGRRRGRSDSQDLHEIGFSTSCLGRWGAGWQPQLNLKKQSQFSKFRLGVRSRTQFQGSGSGVRGSLPEFHYKAGGRTTMVCLSVKSFVMRQKKFEICVNKNRPIFGSDTWGRRSRFFQLVLIVHPVNALADAPTPAVPKAAKTRWRAKRIGQTQVR